MGGDGTVYLAIAVDLYNGEITGRRTMTLTAAKNDPHHVPCSLIPYTLKIRGGCDGGEGRIDTGRQKRNAGV